MKVYSVAETAKIFDVSVQAVYAWIKEGKIQYKKTPGGTIRIPKSEIDKYTEIKSDE